MTFNKSKEENIIIAIPKPLLYSKTSPVIIGVDIPPILPQQLQKATPMLLISVGKDSEIKVYIAEKPIILNPNIKLVTKMIYIIITEIVVFMK